MRTDAEAVRAQLRISCADATTLLTEYDEHALMPADRDRMDAHLSGCQACGVYLDQLRTVATTTRHLADHDDGTSAKTLETLLSLYRRTWS